MSEQPGPPGQPELELLEQPPEIDEPNKITGKKIVKIALQSLLIAAGIFIIGLCFTLLAPLVPFIPFSIATLALTAAFPLGLATDKGVEKLVDKGWPKSKTQLAQQNNLKPQVALDPSLQAPQIQQNSNTQPAVSLEEPKLANDKNQPKSKTSLSPNKLKFLEILARTGAVLGTLALTTIVVAAMPFTLAPLLTLVITCGIGSILGCVADFEIVKGFKKLEEKGHKSESGESEHKQKQKKKEGGLMWMRCKMCLGMLGL